MLSQGYKRQEAAVQREVEEARGICCHGHWQRSCCAV